MAYPYQSYQNPYQQGYYPMYQQPQIQPVQQPVMPQNAANFGTTQSSIIWIGGDREAQMYPVAPNNAVTLWSTTEPVVYLKQADASGKPTLKVYDLVERTEAMSDKATAEEYATKADLGAVVGVVKDFNDVVSALKSDVETMKGDIYGLAGKKKTVKKQEADDE